jgi:hypothetical protein
MFSMLLLAWALMAACVVIHALGQAVIVRGLRRRLPDGTRMWPWTWVFVQVAGWIILLHLVEISVWAAVYAWQSAMPDLPSALYFSGVTYTTTGYGDLVLPANWRLVGAVEALTGILMCAWSTGFFVAIVSRMLRNSEADGRTP